MRTVDADAHVLETERTFELMDEADRKFAPTVLIRRDGASKTANDSSSYSEHWLIDNRILNKNKNKDSATPEASREMSDVDSRLKHMDELDIGLYLRYSPLGWRVPGQSQPSARRQGYERRGAAKNPLRQCQSFFPAVARRMSWRHPKLRSRLGAIEPGYQDFNICPAARPN